MRSGCLFWNCQCAGNCSKASVTEKSDTLCTLHHISKCAPRSSARRPPPASCLGNCSRRCSTSCVLARRLGEEQCNEFVQEAAPERRRPEVFMAGIEQTARPGLGQRFLQAGGIESGTFAEKHGGHTLCQAQGVEHEFERQLGPGRPLFAAEPSRGTGCCKIVARLFHFPQARDTFRIRDLGVRTGADAEIIAELPVVEIVPATAPGGRSRTSSCFAPLR